MTEVYLYEIPDISDERLKELSAYVSVERRAKIQRLKHRNKQRQSLFAALLLRAVLCEKLKVDNDRLQFSVTAKGKPFLTGYPNLHFSISHTEGLVAVAVSALPVGIDAEKMGKAEPKLCERFFSSPEQDFVAVADDGWLERFYLVWTRKEAFLKRSGEGLSVPLASFSTVDPKQRELTTFVTKAYTVSVCGDCELEVKPTDDSQAILEKFLKEQDL